MILGTGTNACYVESRANVQAMAADAAASPRTAKLQLETVIDTEWGAFTTTFVPLLLVCTPPLDDAHVCTHCVSRRPRVPQRYRK